MVVIKRDGRRVEFNGAKIRQAIEKGFLSVRKYIKTEEVDQVLNEVEDRIKATNLTEISIETIQDFVEDAIKHQGFEDVYSSFRGIVKTERVQERISSLVNINC